MKIREEIVIEINKDEKVFRFSLPVGATWGTTLDAAFEVLAQINSWAQAATKNAEPKKEKETFSKISEEN